MGPSATVIVRRQGQLALINGSTISPADVGAPDSSFDRAIYEGGIKPGIRLFLL